MIPGISESARDIPLYSTRDRMAQEAWAKYRAVLSQDIRMPAAFSAGFTLGMRAQHEWAASLNPEPSEGNVAEAIKPVLLDMGWSARHLEEPGTLNEWADRIARAVLNDARTARERGKYA